MPTRRNQSCSALAASYGRAMLQQQQRIECLQEVFCARSSAHRLAHAEPCLCCRRHKPRRTAATHPNPQNTPFEISHVHSFPAILSGARPQFRGSPITHASRPTGGSVTSRYRLLSCSKLMGEWWSGHFCRHTVKDLERPWLLNANLQNDI